MWNYYRDVTLYALGTLPIMGFFGYLMTESLLSALVYAFLTFAFFGTGIGVIGFGQFQGPQYYLYYNLGFTKKELILKTWGCNWALGSIVALVIIGLQWIIA